MTAENQIHFYGAIEKFDAADDGSLMVSGIASTESVDSQGEVITADAMRKALPAYIQKGTVREMHQPLAAGVPISAHVDDDGKTHFTAKIVDAGTIAKIKAGVLKGFSIGGRALAKAGNKITEILLKDISVVDIPCNPESYFTIIKFDKPAMKTCKHCDEPIEKCGGKCSGAMDEKKKFDQIDSIAATVNTLVKGFETLKTAIAGNAAPKVKIGDEEMEVGTALAKVLGAVGEIQKTAKTATEKAVENEKGNVIEKLMIEGRVIYKDDGTAAKIDELQKMDLPLLKFAARNAQVLPTVAKATYSGNGKGPDENQFTKTDRDGKTVALAGSELIQKAWEGMTLSKMIKAGTTANL